MAPVQTKLVLQLLLPLRALLVSRVRDPAVRLHQGRGPQVLVLVPPVRRAGGGAARAEDALVHAVQLGAVLAGLEMLGGEVVRGGLGGLEPGLDGLVLLVELGEVRNKVFDDVH